MNKVHNRMIEGAPVSIRDFESLVVDGDWYYAIVAANATGKQVFFNNDEYLVSQSLVPDGWDMVGETQEGVSIKLADNVNNNVISILGGTSFSLSNMTIDHNKANQTGGHCIRFGGVDDVKIKNVTLKNAYSYGIGFQAGTNKNVLIQNLTTIDSGQDGIDIKDYDLANENIVLDNITCINYGLNATGQTAIDVRGPVTLSNLEARTTAPDTRAFRFRGATSQGRAGSGVINNIKYYGAGDAASYALQISTGVKDYSINNLYGENAGLLAVFETGSAGIVKNIVGKNLSGDALSIGSTGVNIDGITIDGCLRGFDIEATAPNNRISNFTFTNVSSGEWGRIQAGSTGCNISHGIVEVGKSLSFAEKPTLSDITNYKTRNVLISPELEVDSLGTKAFLIPHGLNLIPDLQDIQLTVIRSTGDPVDYELGFVQVEAADATNVSCRIFVTLASGITGARVRVGVRVSSFE